MPDEKTVIISTLDDAMELVRILTQNEYVVTLIDRTILGNFEIHFIEPEFRE